jgi:hypothetical protein
MSDLGAEATRRGGEGFADAVTVSFADPERGWYGMARLGVTAEHSSALAVLFRGRDVAGALAQGELAEGEGPLAMAVEVPFERWTVRWDGADTGFDLTLDAACAPAERTVGMDGYEQLVRVTGTVRAGGEETPIVGSGQRGHAWGVVDWSDLTLVRGVSAWLGDGGILLESARPRKAAGHDAEDVWATLVQEGEPIPIADPRLSTTYDGDGHQRRAGLELWVTDDEDHPLRAAGSAICGSSLDLGALTMDLAFFRWSAEGVQGVGRYDVIRKRAE